MMDLQILEINMTNSLSYVSLAYKIAFVMAAAREAEELSVKLDLPIPIPVQSEHFSSVRVSSPNFGAGVGGSVIVGGNYFFGFHKGRMHTVATTRFRSDDLLREDLRRLAGQESRISNSEAYSLALGYLESIGFETGRYLQSASTNVVRWEFGPNRLLLPIFEVCLKHTNSTSNVEIIIDGSKEAAKSRLMSLSILGDEAWQLLRRPLIVITNALELNAQPDPKIKKIEHK